MMTLEEIKDKYIITGDYHTHTVYSAIGPYKHGKGTILDNARAAYERGLRELAITDHGPSDFYGLDTGHIPDMREDIAKAMKAYPDLKIYLGVEADIVDSENGLDVAPENFKLFDFVNAGYHYVPNSKMMQNIMAFHGFASEAQKERLRRENTERIVRALEGNDIRILTHPGDKAFIDEEAVAKACEETCTLIEINARHSHPNSDDLKIYASYDVKFIISSDAHRPANVGSYEASLAMAIAAGIEVGRIVNIEERKQEAL